MTTFLDDEDFFSIDGFFAKELVDAVSEEMSDNPGQDFIDKHGVWQGKKIATYRKMVSECWQYPNLSKMLDMVTDAFSRSDLRWHYVNYQLLYLPWDIHSDWESTGDRVTYYNLVIPLEDAEASTILFDQRLSGSRNFSDYKDNNQPLADPVPEDVWNQHLGMCWPHDRPYLSIREILPKQRKGQLQGFRSDIIHSSDNFHEKMAGPKKFIQAMLSVPL